MSNGVYNEERISLKKQEALSKYFAGVSNDYLHS